MVDDANEKVEEQTKNNEVQRKISEQLKAQVETLKLSADLNEQKQNEISE